MKLILTSELLEREILDIKESSPNKLVAYNRIIVYLRRILDQYRQGILKNGFKDIEHEIQFFKYDKQIPQSQLIYYLQLRSIELKYPFDGKARKKYLIKKNNSLDGFFCVHSNFVKYVELEQTHLDHFYFTRSHLNENENLSPRHLLDLNFNTSHDILLSEFKAFKKLYSKLCIEISKAKTPQNLNKTNSLDWTSSKVALIELIYALQINRSINHGKADLITIAAVFEDLFNIKLDNIYKTYSEIKSRKGRRTKFMDELTWQFEKKLQAEDSI